ncbi:MAG: hypothetical protein LBC02_01230, partial [Planctomycetaceae bacterium]|nr:hypothetical protein [Planctomycetaceae bacterium]
MKTKNDTYDVLKDLRKIRKKISKETKNMSIAERMEYYRKGAERFDARLEQYRKEKNEKRNETLPTSFVRKNTE